MNGLSWRLFIAELRRGELIIVCLAIILAVSSVWLFSSVTYQVEAALVSRSSDFLAADRVVRSAHPVELPLEPQASQRQLNYAEQLLFPTMVFAGDEMALANVKAVSANYPLRGELLIRPALLAQGEVSEAPLPGEAWLAERLFYQLGIDIGADIEVGDKLLRVSGVIEREPDAPFSVFMTSPRVLINLQDAEATGVIQPGSRLSYRYQFAGSEASLTQLDEWLRPRLADNQRLLDVHTAGNPLSEALERAQRFLLLAGLIGVLLASSAIAVASRLYCRRHYDVVAIFKVLGAQRRQVQRVYLTHWCLIVLTAVLLGLALGAVLQLPLSRVASQALDLELPMVWWRPLLVAGGTGWLCALAFTLPTLAQLFGVAPLRVIRRDHDASVVAPWQVALWIVLAVFVLLYWYSASLQLSLLLMGGGMLAILLIVALQTLVLRGLTRWREHSRSLGMRLAISSLYQRASSNQLQLLGFSIAIMLALLIWVVQRDLIAQWEQQVPEDAPNHFVLNIAPNQLPEIEQQFADAELSVSQLYPMVRGRLISVNDEAVSQRERSDEFDEKQSERRPGPGRELNLSFADTLDDNNKIVAGNWHGSEVGAQASVEQEFAERLGLQLGDRLLFRVGGLEALVTVTSLRSVDWNSMQPNFYVLMSTDVLDNFGHSYMGSFHLPEGNSRWLSGLLREFPTLVVIDVAALIARLQGVVEQVGLALKLVFAIVLVASSLVLLAQTQGSLDERKRQLVVLRTLGAGRATLRASIVWEFVLLGAVAGVVAACCSQLLLNALQYWVFESPLTLAWSLWLAGPISGALVVALVGALRTSALLKLNSAQLVRRIS